MIQPSKNAFTAILLIGATCALSGCGQPPADSSPTTVDFLQLYPTAQAPTAKLFVDAGASVEIRWDVDATTNGPLRLVYYDTPNDQEVTISSSATDGSYAWSVPTNLDADTEYTVRAYSANAESGGAAELVALAVSAPFAVVPANDTNSNGEPTPCSTNGECDDGLYCNGIETCTNGVCVAGQSPCEEGFLCNEGTQQCVDATCTTSDDCGSSGFCVDGACVLSGSSTSDLQGYATDSESGAQVDLTQAMTVGDVIRLEAPAAISAEAFALRTLVSVCSCGWRTEPVTAGSFAPDDACTTSFIAESAGSFLLIVDTSCDGITTRYLQLASAESVPVPLMCNSNGDCGADLVCLDGACAEPAPPAPTIQVLQERAFAPFVVQFDLRLEDASGNVIPDGVSDSNFRVLEDGAAIDLTETNLFVTPAANLPLRIVLVLDYTSSMEQSGAIASMIEAARSFVEADHFTGTHHIGIVEFHDRGSIDEGFGLAVPLTVADESGKSSIASAIPDVGDVESGLSRVWDAVELAITTLKAVERKTGEVQAIVFLTDGRDTTSESDTESIIKAATESESEINLYPIGFGAVADNEAVLRDMATQTGGAYFPASDGQALQAVFENIALDLRGQWNLTYITPRNTGSVPVALEFTWQEQAATYETTIEASQLSGDIHTGIVDVLERTYDDVMNRTSFLLAARYIPRNVDRFQFFIPNAGATFTLQGAGGLTDPAAGWTLTDLGDGTMLLFGFDALEYGAFGNIGTITVPGNITQLQISHDDSVYAFWPQPKSIVFEGDDWAAPYTLTVNISPEGAGTVNVTPSRSGYAEGETVQLQAIPSGTIFSDWTGADIGTNAVTSIVMDSDHEVTAVFTTSSP